VRIAALVALALYGIAACVVWAGIVWFVAEGLVEHLREARAIDPLPLPLEAMVAAIAVAWVALALVPVVAFWPLLFVGKGEAILHAAGFGPDAPTDASS